MPSPQQLIALHRLPRVRFAHLPTPVEPLPRLSKYLGGPELWIKRDDQTGLATGGNKARKLEFLMAEALDAGADTVITAGSTQSNHARQTAAAAARIGLDCHLALYSSGGTAPSTVAGNILLDHLLGATIHWTDEHAPYTVTIGKIEATLQADGKHPHVIPYGGSSLTGMMGYVLAMEELAMQEQVTGPLDALVFATSSGGTQAGMALGAHLTGLEGRVRVCGISVDQPRAAFAARVADLANMGAERLHCEWRCDPANLEVFDGYLGGGYAVIGDPEREAIRLMARLEGILVDPVYTGRALAGLIDLIRNKEFTSAQRVLFWHTGGSAAVFAFSDELMLD